MRSRAARGGHGVAPPAAAPEAAASVFFVPEAEAHAARAAAEAEAAMAEATPPDAASIAAALMAEAAADVEAPYADETRLPPSPFGLRASATSFKCAAADARRTDSPSVRFEAAPASPAVVAASPPARTPLARTKTGWVAEAKPPSPTKRRSSLASRKSLKSIVAAAAAAELEEASCPRRLWLRFAAFCRRCAHLARNEHTLVNLYNPPDDEAALTDAQVVQIFCNTLAIELVGECLLFSDDDDEGFSFQPVTVIITGVIGSGMCFAAVFICRAVFRWGNRRRITRCLPRCGGCARRPAGAALPPAPAGALSAKGGRQGSALDGVAPQAALTLTAGERAKAKHKERVRGKAAYRCRSGFAWLFNLAWFAAAEVLTIIYGVGFGRAKTKAMFLGWLTASGMMWGVIEPVQVVLIALLPRLLDNEKVARARLVYNEVFA